MSVAGPGPRRRRLRVGVAALVLCALGAAAAALWWARSDAPEPPATAAADATTDTPAATASDAIARGAYLARVGNCAGCHTARGGAAYAGGRGLPTPFGTVFAGNLTPEPETGLGRWSADDLWRALHQGRARDGRLLAPAFPYTEFTHVSRADSDALYAFLRTLPPVVQPKPPQGLRFPFDTQLALAVWRALYFRPAAPGAEAEPGRSEEWQRGAYLVRGLGHCAACHAPRNLMGATVHAEHLAGGSLPLQPWFAPALGPDGSDPAAQRQRYVDLLRSGQSSRGTASGPMAEVVFKSTQYWTPPDLQAAATYLLSLPPQAPSDPAAAAAPEARERGARLYAERCAKCHGDEGEGARGAYPPLAGNPTVTLPDPGNALQVLRHGGFAPTTAANPQPYGMPPSELAPQDMADVLSYVRQAWGNRADPVTVQQAMRAP
jgi:mono/diheme cytochrome c family protein